MDDHVTDVSGEVLDGVVRPGPPPADALRPEVVIQREDGTVTQAVIHLPDGTAVEITEADLDPGPLIEPARWVHDTAAFHLNWRIRQAFSAHLIDPRDIVRITAT
jgi:hypothetical protein